MTDDRWLDRDGTLTALAATDGVVILPTDTLPGLHARLDRPRALARLQGLKGRDAAKPFLVLCADAAMVHDLVRSDGDSAARTTFRQRYLARLWPGPFTAILPAATMVPGAVAALAGTVAVRVPAPSALRDLLQASGPLASTSVNRAGEAPALDLAAATACFPDLPAWRAGWPGGEGQASALIDLTAETPGELRPGPRPLPAWDDLLS